VISAFSPASAAALPRPRTHTPSFGAWISLALTALIGSVTLLPVLVVLVVFAGWKIALLAWLVWIVLAIPFTLPGMANALGRSIVGWREPDTEERVILHHACVRVCVAAGADPESFTLRIARGTFNAHSSGRSVLATTADVVTGADTAEMTEIEAMLAHELAHHRHGDLLLAGPMWWLLAPLAPLDRLLAIIARLPLMGRPVAAAIQLPFRLLIFPLRAVSSLASRPRELMADRFAVDCGYGVPLERVLTRFAAVREGWAGGMVDWILSTHPGPTDRITHIRNADAAGDRSRVPKATS
jgi:Zn-dependent protease with chaperone function